MTGQLATAGQAEEKERLAKYFNKQQQQQLELRKVFALEPPSPLQPTTFAIGSLLPLESPLQLEPQDLRDSNCKAFASGPVVPIPKAFAIQWRREGCCEGCCEGFCEGLCE